MIPATPFTKLEPIVFKAEHLGMIPPSSSDRLEMRSEAEPELKRLGVLDAGKLPHTKSTAPTMVRKVSPALNETREQPSSGGELTL